MATITETLETALRHHQGGDLARAEVLYRQVLQTEPRQVDALHLLGVLAHQVGRADIALEYISQAVNLVPSQPIFHNSLARVYQTLGKMDHAMAACREALRLQPDFTDAHLTLGNILGSLGRFAEAEASYREVI